MKGCLLGQALSLYNKNCTYQLCKRESSDTVKNSSITTKHFNCLVIPTKWIYILKSADTIVIIGRHRLPAKRPIIGRYRLSVHLSSKPLVSVCVVTWSKWICISRCLCVRLGNAVELRHWAVLPPHLVVVVHRLLCLVNVADQCLPSFTRNSHFSLRTLFRQYRLNKHFPSKHGTLSVSSLVQVYTVWRRCR